MSLPRRSYAYSKMEREEPEERLHRRAQFLIYKVLEQADSRRSEWSLRVRVCRLKVKIGKRLKRLRKTMLFTISAARTCVYRQVATKLKIWKRFIRGRDTLATLPPIFT